MIDESKMTLAVDMNGSRSVVGLLASEKLNGCRAFWDGRQFWTRGGRPVDAPRWFTRGLPGVPLDGEIWAGRGRGVGNDNSGFKVASNAVRFGGRWFDETDDRHPLRFAAFDYPQHPGCWAQRMAEVRQSVRGCAHASAVRVTRIGDIHHFTEYLTRLRKLGAEGGMFRDPAAVGYEFGRSSNLLRLKFDSAGSEWAMVRPRPHRPSRRLCAGLDVSQFPFDPEIEYNIRLLLSRDTDYHSLTKRGRAAFT